MTDKIKAIVLAAGYFSRMTCMKALLPLGETTVLERVCRCFLKPFFWIWIQRNSTSIS